MTARLDFIPGWDPQHKVPQMSTKISTKPMDSDIEKDVETPVSVDDRALTLPPSVDFPVKQKVLITTVLCFMTLSLTYSSSAYASSVTHIEQHFNASTEVVLLGIALIVLGFAVGPLLFGPLAHLIGGRPVYVGTYLCFTAFAFGASEAKDIRTLIVMRFFMGCFGSSSLNNTAATIGEMVMPADIGKYMIWYALAVAAGPGLGPVIASFIDHRVGFRWNLRIQAIFIAITTLFCILFVRETGSPALKRESTKTREGRRAFVVSTCKRALIGPFVWLFAEPVITLICVYLSLLYGIMYGFFVVVPYTFRGIRHWSEESTGLIFIGLLVGFCLSVPVMGKLQRSYEENERNKLPRGSSLPPEVKLQQMLWASILPPIGLFFFAWTAPFPHVHWIAPAIGMALFGLGMMIVYVSLIPYMVEYAALDSQLALAASTFTRAAFGCGFPLFTLQMYRAMTVQGATSLLAGVSLLLVPMPYVLKRYGASLRAKSKRARKDG